MEISPKIAPRTSLYQSDFHSFAQSLSGFTYYGLQIEGQIIRIQESGHHRQAGFHPNGQFCLGHPLFGQSLSQLPSRQFFSGPGIDLLI
jgi:hypothetical protein